MDLWIDKTANPAAHIANAFRTELAREDGAMAKALKKMANMSKLIFGARGNGLSFDLSEMMLAPWHLYAKLACSPRAICAESSAICSWRMLFVE